MSIITDNLDWILAIVVLIGAIWWFVKFRLLPRSKTARDVKDEVKTRLKRR